MALQDNALVSVAQVVARLARVSVTEADTSYLEDLINSISDDFEQYCNREFTEAVVTGYEATSPDRQFITLPRRPVTSIQSITFDGVELDTKADDEYGGYYIADEDAGKIGRQIGWWFQGFVNNALEYSNNYDTPIINIVIDYTGGYATIPANLQNAALTEIVREYQLQNGDYRTAVSEKLQSVNVKYSEGDIDNSVGGTGYMTKTLKVLNKYRNVVVK